MKTRRNLLIIIALIIMSKVVGYAQTTTYDWPTLLSQARVSAEGSGGATPFQVFTWVLTQNANGSWSGLYYGGGSVDGENADHLKRILSIARGVTKSGGTDYNNITSLYKDAVKNGLKYWYDQNVTTENFYWMKIKYPRLLGMTLVLMRKFPGFIPTTASPGIDEPELISRFKPTSLTTSTLTKHGAGANMLDIGLGFTLRAILTQDSALLTSTRDKIIANMSGTNLKVDKSFHDHGPQLQVYSYGEVFAGSFGTVGISGRRLSCSL